LNGADWIDVGQVIISAEVASIVGGVMFESYGYFNGDNKREDKDFRLTACAQ
jgi:hypothetical protein